MRYATWVERVFDGFLTAAEKSRDFSLMAVAEAIGIAGLDWDAFARHESVTDALVSAAHDLAELDLVAFEDVSQGNNVTPYGRDVAERGIRSLRPEISAITLRPVEALVQARIYEATRIEELGWAGLGGADTDGMSSELWPDLERYYQQMRMMEVLGDLDRKGLITRAISGPGPRSQRPTYIGVVRIAEPDGRDDGLEAGLLD